MTDVQVVESGLPKTQRKRVRKPQPDAEIPYDAKAIAKGKRLAATLKAGDEAEWKLGELADRLEPKYGKKTLANFASEIGLIADRLNRCRHVYRAWKDIRKKGTSPKFGVAQALAAHPLRDSIIKDFPKLTVREARTFMRDWRIAHPAEDHNMTGDEARRWFAAAIKHAADSIKYGFPAQSHLDPDILEQALDRPDTAIATLRSASRAFASLADAVERALAPPLALPKPDFDV
jgi:hypothetical protein